MSDYIKREDAYREIMECFKNSEMPEEWEHGMHTAGMIVLQDVPSADVVEVRHGRWIGKTYKCSLYGKWVDPLQGDADMNYCPNCGAKMDGEEQGHESDSIATP